MYQSFDTLSEHHRSGGVHRGQRSAHLPTRNDVA